MRSSVISIFNTFVILCILIIVGILYSKYKDKIAGLMSAGKMYIDNKDKITTLLDKSDTASQTFDKVCKDGIDVNIPKGSLMKFKMPLGGGTLEVPQSDAMINVPVDCS